VDRELTREIAFAALDEVVDEVVRDLRDRLGELIATVKDERAVRA
jgi:hypothetical protein